MSFDYSWTCSYIDQDISSFKEGSFETCKQFLQDVIDEGNVDISEDVFNDKVKALVDELYSDAEDIFENTRSHNEDMRSAADTQVDVLKSEVEELEEERDNLQKRVDELETGLSDLQEDIEAERAGMIGDE